MEKEIKKVIKYCKEKEKYASKWIKYHRETEDWNQEGAWCIEKLAYYNCRRMLEEILKENSPCRKAAKQRIAT